MITSDNRYAGRAEKKKPSYPPHVEPMIAQKPKNPTPIHPLPKGPSYRGGSAVFNTIGSALVSSDDRPDLVSCSVSTLTVSCS